MSFSQDKLDHTAYGHDVWVRDIAQHYPKTRIYNVCTDIRCLAAKDFAEETLDFVNRYVALIDGGTLKWFDSKIWYDAEKAKQFYNDLYGGSDLIITVMPVGQPV